MAADGLFRRCRRDVISLVPVGLQDEQLSLVHVTRRKWFLLPVRLTPHHDFKKLAISPVISC
jgi:hypothetical protein